LVQLVRSSLNASPKWYIHSSITDIYEQKD
jgi:hypothetical protein